MDNGNAFIVFVAVEANNAKNAEDLLAHHTQGLKVIASTNKEINQRLLASKNNPSTKEGFVLTTTYLTKI